MKTMNANLMARANLALRKFPNCRFRNRSGYVLRDGGDLTILTTEQTATEALLAARKLERECVKAKIISIRTDSPMNRDLFREACRTGMVFVIDSPDMTGRWRRMMETAFESESPLRIRSVRLSVASAENGLAEMYDRGATEIYEQIVNAA